MSTRSVKRLKNPNVKRKLDLENGQQTQNSNLDSEQENGSTNNNYLTEVSADQRKKYNLRELEKQSYHDDGSEDFSPDVSEYVPSPKRFKMLSYSSSSSPGGQSQKVSRTPSSLVSNLSVILENNDIALDTIDEADEDAVYSRTSLLSSDFLKIPLDITLKPVQSIDYTGKKNERILAQSNSTSSPVQTSSSYLVNENKNDVSNKLLGNNNEKFSQIKKPSSLVSNLSVILENNDIALDTIDEADEDAVYSRTSLLSSDFLKSPLDITLKPVQSIHFTGNKYETILAQSNSTSSSVQTSSSYPDNENKNDASNKLLGNNNKKFSTTNQPGYQNYDDIPELHNRKKLNIKAILRTNNLLDTSYMKPIPKNVYNKDKREKKSTKNQPNNQELTLKFDTTDLETRAKLNPKAILVTNNIFMEISPLHDSRSIKSSPKNGYDKSQEEHSTHSDPVANVSSFYQQKAIVTSPESENLLQNNFLLDTADSQCSAPAIVREQDSRPSDSPEAQLTAPKTTDDEDKRQDFCPSGSPEAQLTAPRTTDDEDKRQDSCPSGSPEAQLTAPRRTDDEDKRQDSYPSGSPEAQLTAPRTTDDEDKRQDSCPSGSPEAQLTAPRTTDDEDKRQDSCPSGSPEAQLTAPRTTDDEDKRQDSYPSGSPEAQLTAPRTTDDEDKRQDSCPSGSPEAQLTAPRRTDDEDKRQDSCPSGSSEAQLTAPRTTDDEDKRQDSCPSNSIYSQLAASEYDEKRDVSCPLESIDFQLTARNHQQQIACSVLKTDKVMVPFPVSDQVRSSISSQSEAEQNHKNPFGILNEDTNIENNVNEYIEVIIRQESDQNLTEVKDKYQDFLDTPEHQFTAAKQKQQIAGCVLQPDDIIIPFPEFDQVRNTISSRPDTEGNLIKPLEIIDKDKSIDHSENEYIEIVIIQESDESFDNVSAIVHEGEKSPVHQTDEIIEENQLAAFSTPKKLTRKRMRNKDVWHDNKNKKLKNSGEEYVGCRTKKTNPKKEMKPVCNCAKNCSEKIAIEQRVHIFNKYYNLGDHALQWQFIERNTTVENVKRITIERTKNRTQTIKYSFNIDGVTIPVCKVYFLNTLSISEQTVYTALEKVKKDDKLTDDRGHHFNRPHKIKPATEESIMTHIQLFPSVESHYVRKDSKRQYLSENLNISKMYRLYKKWFSHQNNYTSDQLASRRQYETIFNTKFNYSFFKPKKDLCATCSLYRQADETKKKTLEVAYKKHVERKDKVRDIKKNEKKEVDNRNDTTVAVFDLEKVINIPKSEVGIFYYKRKYPVYNLTIFDATRRLGYCYVWHSSIAKRGAIEVGSCLLLFMKQENQKGIMKISFYSDGCAGQNKNRFIFGLYLYAAKTLKLEITHRFYETGHSQNEGDCMHSCIETELKNKIIYTPDQVYGLIMNAKKSGEKYVVKEMEQTDIFDIKKLVLDQDWIRDTAGKKISWSKIMEVRVSPSMPDILQFKYEFDDEYSELNTAATPQVQVTRRTRRQRSTTTSSATSDIPELSLAYNQPIPIRKLLHRDLMSLCDSEHIPTHYRPFYDSLVCDNEQDVLSEDETSE